MSMSESKSHNLFEVFRNRFPADEKVPFLKVDDGRTFTYDDLNCISAKYANVLTSLGLKPGERVLAQIKKSPESVFLYLACLRTGAVFLPLNTAYQANELDYFLGDSEPTVVVGDPHENILIDLCTSHKIPNFLTLSEDGSGTLNKKSQIAEAKFVSVARTDSDIAAILYSSGTTGQPKGVMLSHANLAANAEALHNIWRFGPDDVLLHTLPIFHTHGLFVAIHTVLLNGTGMIFHTQFNAENVIKDLPTATVFMGVPTYYVRLLASKKLTRNTCRNIRLFLSGSAPLLDETFCAFEKRTGKKIVERYGMTEAGIITSAVADKPRNAGDVGWPLPGVSLCITDDNNAELSQGKIGEIKVKGPGLFRGYWRRPEKTEKEFTVDGFFKTGDLARVNESGMISIVGRKNDMIISGGFNVYPKEIEAAIDKLPGVEESAVISMTHPEFGEAGLAVVVMAPEAKTLRNEEMRAVLIKDLANYKIPKLFVLTNKLPRNAMGKVQKNLLRNGYEAQWNAYLKTINS